MSEQESSDQNRPPTRTMRISPATLRATALDRQSIGGYSRKQVDDLLERAAKTIENLGASVTQLTEKVEALERDRASTEAARSEFTEILLTAQRTANLVKEESQHAAEQLLAGAHAERARITQLKAAAETALRKAREDVDGLLRDARVERERLLGTMTEEAASARAELEAGNTRLEAAAAELRGSLTNRIHEALAALDRIQLQPKSEAQDSGERSL